MKTPKRASKPVSIPEASTASRKKASAPKHNGAPPKEKLTSPKRPAVLVRLELYAPDAREVYVVGSFNGWIPTGTALRSTKSGQWSGELALEPGRYEYLFRVDGRWLPDPQAKAQIPNPFGGINSLLEV